MAKIYGGRWKLLRSLDQGGQAQVFVVEDLQEKYPESVLKRILNINRKERYLRELEALRRMQHPNIVEVLDWANTDDESCPLYIVMPLLHGGNLENRRLLYKDSLDSTLIVSMALASALSHVHGHDIVHRDVKPANILFADNGPVPVLADFGICRHLALEHLTEAGEVPGPRGFLAPELEHGSDTASPAADVYSLGKVIYYALTGGVVLPREALRSTQFDIFRSAPHRHQQLGLLLDRMICPLDSRLKSMSQVVTELQRIKDWESTITLVSNPQLESLTAGVVERARAQRQAEVDDATQRREREARMDAVASALVAWLQPQLQEFAAKHSAPELVDFSTSVAQTRDFMFNLAHSDTYRSVTEVALTLTRHTAAFYKEHKLIFVLARKAGLLGGHSSRSDSFAFVATYADDKSTSTRQYILSQRYQSSQRDHFRVPIHSTFLGESVCLGKRFDVDAWPSACDLLSRLVSEAIQQFLLAAEGREASVLRITI